MSTFRTLLLVTRREIVERGRSKAYLLSSGFTTLMVVAVLLIPTLFAGGARTFTIGLVGGTGSGVVETARALAATEDGDQVRFETTDLADRAAAEAALLDGTVDAALDGDTLLVERSSNGFFGDAEAEGRLQRAAASRRIQELVADDEGAGDVIALLTGDPLTVESVSGQDVDEAEANGRGLVAFGGLMLMYIAVLTYGNWTLSGVTEEKTNRVVEVLLSAVRPWHLLAGKVAGIGALGIAQFLVTLGAVLATIAVTDLAQLPQVPVSSFAMLVLWFVLGFGLYSVIYAAAGSLVSRMEEAQNVAFPITIVAVAGFFASVQVLDDPSGTLAAVLSFVPFTAPFVVPVRHALDALPLWQSAGAAVVTAATIYGLLRLAGRVYAGGLLRFGARVGWREAFRSAEM
jgi:ABC-2 type transport system permease protein